jgi:hypothetical protein
VEAGKIVKRDWEQNLAEEKILRFEQDDKLERMERTGFDFQ